ncbi:hypothetical protein Anapl_07463 [Anas platyrhynchos]|uniref:Uncharacterized protein n=1 Tax=Anas platyrhynchos TaxID=8839 RepID=R0L700_ANAPL|nr:hypothetical protein Anapl_07463 [Anas platyrhynchos]
MLACLPRAVCGLEQGMYVWVLRMVLSPWGPVCSQAVEAVCLGNRMEDKLEEQSRRGVWARGQLPASSAGREEHTSAMDSAACSRKELGHSRSLPANTNASRERSAAKERSQTFCRGSGWKRLGSTVIQVSAAFTFEREPELWSEVTTVRRFLCVLWLKPPCDSFCCRDKEVGANPADSWGSGLGKARSPESAPRWPAYKREVRIQLPLPSMLSPWPRDAVLQGNGSAEPMPPGQPHLQQVRLQRLQVVTAAKRGIPAPHPGKMWSKLFQKIVKKNPAALLKTAHPAKIPIRVNLSKAEPTGPKQDEDSCLAPTNTPTPLAAPSDWQQGAHDLLRLPSLWSLAEQSRSTTSRSFIPRCLCSDTPALWRQPFLYQKKYNSPLQPHAGFYDNCQHRGRCWVCVSLLAVINWPLGGCQSASPSTNAAERLPDGVADAQPLTDPLIDDCWASHPSSPFEMGTRRAPGAAHAVIHLVSASSLRQSPDRDSGQLPLSRGLPRLSSSEQGECWKEQMLENCLWPAPAACEDSSCVAAASPSTWQIRCQDVVSWAPSSDDDCDFLGIAFLAYSAQPAWSRPRRDERSKPARSTSSWQGGPHGNYYSSFAVLKNKLSIISVKTGEEEPRERPAAQKPGAHVSALLVARLSSKPCCDVRNVTATLRKGLASCLTIGSKKKETKEKKIIVCKSIVESHQDGAINNRRDITCRPHRGRVTGPVVHNHQESSQLEDLEKDGGEPKGQKCRGGGGNRFFSSQCQVGDDVTCCHSPTVTGGEHQAATPYSSIPIWDMDKQSTDHLRVNYVAPDKPCKTEPRTRATHQELEGPPKKKKGSQKCSEI